MTGKYNFDFCIAGLNIRIKSPVKIDFPDCFLPFLREEASEATHQGVFEIFVGEYFCKNDQRVRVIKEFPLNDGSKIILSESFEDNTLYYLFVPTSFKNAITSNANWNLLLNLERFFAKHGRVVLHSSCVIDAGEAIIFCAPSGGGKSTQAQIWQEKFGSEMLNGDKVILAVNDGKCIAYGSPIAGTSGIYRDISANVKVVARVEKSEKNAVCKMTKRDAFLTLYSECIRFESDRLLNENVLNTIQEIVAVTDIVRFACVRSHSASVALSDWLNNQ